MASLGEEGGDRESLFDSWDMNESTVMTCQSVVRNCFSLFWTCRRESGRARGREVIVIGRPDLTPRYRTPNAHTHTRPAHAALHCTATAC